MLMPPRRIHAPEPLPEQLASASKPRHRRTDGHLQELRDLALGHLLELEQHEHRAKFERHVKKRILKELPPAAGLELVFRTSLGARVERRRLARKLAVLGAPSLVGGDAQGGAEQEALLATRRY